MHTYNRDVLSENEKINIRSFITTQLEAVQARSSSPELVPNHFLSLLKNEQDVNILTSMLMLNHNLDQYVTKFFKRVKINQHMTVNSTADTKRSRDNSNVVVQQEIDRNERGSDADMHVKSFYYRINCFFEFVFGESRCILAIANELKEKTVILDIVGNLFASSFD